MGKTPCLNHMKFIPSFVFVTSFPIPQSSSFMQQSLLQRGRIVGKNFSSLCSRTTRFSQAFFTTHFAKGGHCRQAVGGFFYIAVEPHPVSDRKHTIHGRACPYAVCVIHAYADIAILQFPRNKEILNLIHVVLIDQRKQLRRFVLFHVTDSTNVQIHPYIPLPTYSSLR